MNKAELESKHLSELHLLAAEAGVERFRMLTRGELIEALAGEEAGGARPAQRERRQEAAPERGGEEGERPRRRRRRRPGVPERPEAEAEAEGRAGEEPEPTPVVSPTPPSAAEEPARPRRRRRRRRFGRRGTDEVTIQGLLLPPESGRQALLCADSAAACTGLLRGVAADLAAESKGPDPVVLLIDPSPEELADWKREAPQAEIVAAGQARHASDALAQASARASGGEDVILLVDSLTRLASAYGDADAAKEFFDAGRSRPATGNGSLTVVAALERA